MAGGLIFSFRRGADIELENLNPVEKFEGLELRKKYGFELSWYTLWGKIQVILRSVEGGDVQVYLADNEIDGESIIGEEVKKAIDEFNINEEDQKEIFKMLQEHGCCYF